MKNYLSLMALLFAFNLKAQIHTSGGANDGRIGEADLVSHHGRWAQQFDLLKKFKAHLNSQNKICRGPSELTKGPEFIKQYISLSIYKNASIKSVEKCSEREAYFKCLKDREYKKQISIISQDPYFVPFLEKHYSISNKEAEDIIKFFQKIDE